MKFLLLALMLFVSSCATKTRDFREKNLDENLGVFYGVMKINYNKYDKTRLCSLVFLDEDDDRSSFIKLDHTGFFIGTAKKNHNYLVRFICGSDVTRSIIEFDKEKAGYFNIKGRGYRSYVGNIEITRITEKNSPNLSFLLGGAIAGALAAEGKKSGENITFKVEDKKNEADELYLSIVGGKSKLKSHSSLLVYPDS